MTALIGGLLALYEQAVPLQFFAQLQAELDLPVRLRIFSLPLLVWLMIYQHLEPKATLSTAVQQVVQQRPRSLLPDHKRIREGTVSGHTGAYSDARQAMPLVVAEKVADRLVEHLMQFRRPALAGWDRRVFVLDGSTVEAPHTPELVEAYPPAQNQHGNSHWPVLLLLLAEELTTGLAQRPCWGPMYGPNAVSEQKLTERVLERLPAASVILGDINFGVFSVAFAATRRGHDALLRLQPNRARSVGRGLPLGPATDEPVLWRPSAYERKQHPDLPADACVHGRFIAQRVKASNGVSQTLYFFTTLPLAVEQVLELYGQRWNIETDLRSLKQTVDLKMLRCQSVDMIAKELVLTIASYNLVRAVMNAAAQQNHLDPRRLSFSRSQDVVLAALPGLEAAATPAEYETRFQRMLQLVASCKLPDRSRRRATPRQVWGHSCKFPKRKPT
jgi:putative transposase